MTTDPRFDEVTGEHTTGHEWDGIEELNTPMPRWWLWIFYATIIFAIGYSIAMPAIPLLEKATPGVLGYSDRAEVAKDLDALRSNRQEMASRLPGATLVDIQGDDDLYRFALAAGKSAYGDNCATCHGAGGQGFIGYPNLNDDVWLWGGTFDEIKDTITVGIRSAHDESRISLMAAYGLDGFLTRPQIREVAEYVRLLSGQEFDAEKAELGAVTFAENCVSCHGAKGTGDRLQGAPNLTDQEWLYGGDVEQIVETIYGGRAGVMPNWDQRLPPETITALAVYVHSLGGGEVEPIMTPAADDATLD